MGGVAHIYPGKSKALPTLILAPAGLGNDSQILMNDSLNSRTSI